MTNYSSSYARISDDSVSGYYGHTDLAVAIEEARKNALSDDISHAWVRNMDTNGIEWDSRRPLGSDAQVYLCGDCRVFDPDNQPSVAKRLEEGWSPLIYWIKVPGSRVAGMPVHIEMTLCDRHSPVKPERPLPDWGTPRLVDPGAGS